MRHTFATLAISAGENINWVEEMRESVEALARGQAKVIPLPIKGEAL